MRAFVVGTEGMSGGWHAPKFTLTQNFQMCPCLETGSLQM